jgi:hypothetical protein
MRKTNCLRRWIIGWAALAISVFGGEIMRAELKEKPN